MSLNGTKQICSRRIRKSAVVGLTDLSHRCDPKSVDDPERRIAIDGSACRLFGFTQLFAEEIDSNQCGYDDCNHHCRTANFLERES